VLLLLLCTSTSLNNDNLRSHSALSHAWMIMLSQILCMAYCMCGISMCDILHAWRGIFHELQVMLHLLHVWHCRLYAFLSDYFVCN